MYSDPQFFDFSLESSKKYPFSTRLDTNWEIKNIQIQESSEKMNDIKLIPVEEIPSKDYTIRIFPSSFSWEVLEEKIYNIETFLESFSIKQYRKWLEVLIFENPSETRGRMKSKHIYMYDAAKLDVEEFLTVFIHEYAHFIDIIWLSPSVSWDISNNFYALSWQDKTVLRPGQLVNDFVSWYSMTNQYEDFAESFLYFVLHNEAFKTRADTSSILKQKYDFFGKYIFPWKSFQWWSFARDENIKDYYWDITKIPIEKEKFLQYLKTSL